MAVDHQPQQTIAEAKLKFKTSFHDFVSDMSDKSRAWLRSSLKLPKQCSKEEIARTLFGVVTKDPKVVETTGLKDGHNLSSLMRRGADAAVVQKWKAFQEETKPLRERIRRYRNKQHRRAASSAPPAKKAKTQEQEQEPRDKNQSWKPTQRPVRRKRDAAGGRTSCGAAKAALDDDVGHQRGAGPDGAGSASAAAAAVASGEAAVAAARRQPSSAADAASAAPLSRTEGYEMRRAGAGTALPCAEEDELQSDDDIFTKSIFALCNGFGASQPNHAEPAAEPAAGPAAKPAVGHAPAPAAGHAPAPAAGHAPAPAAGHTPAPVPGHTPAPAAGHTPAPVPGHTPAPAPATLQAPTPATTSATQQAQSATAAATGAADTAPSCGSVAAAAAASLSAEAHLAAATENLRRFEKAIETPPRFGPANVHLAIACRSELRWALGRLSTGSAESKKKILSEMSNIEELLLSSAASDEGQGGIIALGVLTCMQKVHARVSDML